MEKPKERSIENNGITEGVIWKQLLAFFFPILFGTLFQMLYNTADAVIVGKLLGKQALAAVGGGTSTCINLLIGFFGGLSGGATVIVSQKYGAKAEDDVKASIHNAIAIGITIGIIISILGFFGSKAMLIAIQTPSDIFDLSLDYMRIYFGGAFLVVMYSMMIGIYRAFGDSKSPLVFLICGCLLNIVMDLLMVGVFRLGVKGAAIATLLSQAFSLCLATVKLMRKTDCCRFEPKSIRFHKEFVKKTLSIGLPSGFQSAVYALSNLMIQSSINGYGTDVAAAWAAYGKLDYLFWIIDGAFGISITTFVGQNYGAGKIERSRKGVKTCFLLAYSAGIFLEILYLLCAKWAYWLFTDDPEVVRIGIEMMYVIAPFYILFLAIEILSGAIRGVGKTFVSTLLTMVGIIAIRTAWLIIVPRLTSSLNAILFCYPVTWLITALAFIVYYNVGNIYGDKKRPKEVLS